MGFIRKITATFISAAMAMSLMAGCTSKIDEDDGSVRIVCTVYPIYELTREICGDKAHIELLAKPGVEPHDWEPGSDDMIELEKADLLISCGAGMEPWLESCLGALDNKDLKQCDASKGVDLMDFEESEEHLDEHEHEHGHEHSGTDPHYWLSLSNTKTAVQNISDALCEADKANESFYKEKTDEVLGSIDELEDKYMAELSAYSGETIVVSHEAFGYLCRDLGLKQLAIDGLSPDSEPDAKTVAEIVDHINEEGLNVIFFDSLTDPSVAKTIGDETGAKLLELRTFETVTDSEYESKITYSEIMTGNLESLIEGFGGKQG